MKCVGVVRSKIELSCCVLIPKHGREKRKKGLIFRRICHETVKTCVLFIDCCLIEQRPGVRAAHTGEGDEACSGSPCPGPTAAATKAWN